MTVSINLLLSLAIFTVLMALWIVMIYDMYVNLTKTMMTENVNRFLILILEIIGLMGVITLIAWVSSYVMYYDNTYINSVATVLGVIGLGVGIMSVNHRIRHTQVKR